MFLTAKEIGVIIEGAVEGNPDVKVFKPSRIEDGQEGSISFLANPKYEPFVYSSDASVIIVSNGFKPQKNVNATLIRVKDVYLSVATLFEKFGSQLEQYSGISDKASIQDGVMIGEHNYIGDFAVIEKGAEIGSNCKIFPQVFIGRDTRIGDDCVIYPGVKIYHNTSIGSRCVFHSNVIIGSDGFGFAPRQNGTYKKIAQMGNVIVEDEVEIGANTVIDRATLGSTLIRRGAKLDNLIQIAHNVEIGEHTAIAAQTGVSGSTKIGKHCRIGGQVGFVGHIQVADGAMIQAQSGIAASIKEPNAKVYGSPALPYNTYLRAYSVFRNLPELDFKLNKIERLLGQKPEAKSGEK